jgi:hypothetical protein
VLAIPTDAYSTALLLPSTAKPKANFAPAAVAAAAAWRHHHPPPAMASPRLYIGGAAITCWDMDAATGKVPLYNLYLIPRATPLFSNAIGQQAIHRVSPCSTARGEA